MGQRVTVIIGMLEPRYQDRKMIPLATAIVAFLADLEHASLSPRTHQTWRVHTQTTKRGHLAELASERAYLAPICTQLGHS
jgi:hypothetical protein